MDSTTFVGRERELARLDGFLQKALGGKSQICLITGEAGAGKSALMAEFAQRAQAAHGDVVFALAECNAQTGSSDSYLPWREVIDLLTGGVQEKSHRTLTKENAQRLSKLVNVAYGLFFEFAPDVLTAFIPGGALIARATKMMVGKLDVVKTIERRIDANAGSASAPDLDQSRIFQQYAAALRRLTQASPLVVVLDDLQWADAPSIGLLFHLVRTIEDGALLIVGSYRPDDVAIGRDGGRHPLESTMNEIKRYFGDVWIDLSLAGASEGRQFIDLLLDQEPNALDGVFRDALLQHTGGHPLFTLELIREMKARGDLQQDSSGRWISRPDLDWESLPPRVEGVVAERLARLERRQRDILTDASVEGVEFHVQVLSRLLGTNERDLVRELSRELEKRHHLVQEAAEVRLGRQILSRYRFSHSVFQQYLHNDLTRTERRIYHGDVAAALEQLYAGHEADIAAQLAHHYDEAGDADRAIPYLVQSADRSRGLSAFADAAQSYERALALMDETRAGDGLRAGLLVKLGNVRENLGVLEPARRCFEEALSLARRSGDRAVMAGALSGLGWVAVKQGAYGEARRLCEEALQEAKACENRTAAALAMRRLGVIARRLGDSSHAASQYQASLVLYRELGDREGEIACLNNLANAETSLGDLAAATQHLNDVLAVAREIGNRFTVAIALGNLGEVSRRRGELNSAQDTLRQAIALCRELGMTDSEALFTRNLAEVMAENGDNASAEHAYRSVFQQTLAAGALPMALSALVGLADVQTRSGNAIHAAEWIGLALGHPACDDTVTAEANAVLALLGAQLPPDRLEAAMARGRVLKLEAVAE
ncbi:MAG: tetratricopeptide repeat protein [Chloroflexi bacterium]|nr:tetratricopeptide repeat protein [Chloroflexota bacterium]